MNQCIPVPVGQKPWPRAQFDLVFLDHHKDLYLPDAKLLCRVGGIDDGSSFKSHCTFDCVSASAQAFAFAAEVMEVHHGE